MTGDPRASSRPHAPATRGIARLAAFAVLVLMGACLTVLAGSAASTAADVCGSGGNPIACENAKPGSPQSAWDVDGAGDSDIQGFSTDISVDVGHPIDFKVDTDASAYSITIFRMGWYDGDGARQVATVTPSAHLPQIQPACIWDVSTELTDCGNWGVSATWSVPSDAVSGVYIAHLERADNGDTSNITFIVRDDASHSDIAFQTSDPTWEAYNTYGGSDFYTGAANGRAYKVSYNRPVTTRADEPGGQDFFMANEYPEIRFLERNGYDVSYLAGVDTDRYGGLIKNHKIFMSVGHDEYWSGAQRANVEAARDAGVNLQFLSGNEVYWRTRYEASADASHTPYRTLVSYKEAWSQAKIDPSDESTSTWRDPRYAPQSEGGGLPENALTGTIFMSNATDLPLTVTKAEAQNRLWRNTGLAQMSGDSTALAPHTVGYESDEDQDNGFRPPGKIDLSTTTAVIPDQYMTDYGLTTATGTTTHSLTLYRAPSGALVFGAGTVQWSWGLDDVHDTPYAYEPADPRMQQAQVNLNADMGAQPVTLMDGLQPASASADTTGPTVSITSPDAGDDQPNGTVVKVSGTATDTGGGVVAGVEYSTDGGDSWHPAQGTTNWSFNYTQHGTAATGIKVRAVDDSANIGASVSRDYVTGCPCSIFGNSPPSTVGLATMGPAETSADDPTAVELGLRFTPEQDGFVEGVRFFKGDGNDGTHVGSLWSSSGEQLATVTFANESASGWQSATFSQAVPVSAGQTYTVSYTAPNGHYADQEWAFSEAGVSAPPLHVAGGFGAPAAGVFELAGQYPDLSWHNTNYFVDAIFSLTDDSPLTAESPWPAADATSVPLDTTVGAVLSKPIDQSTLAVTVKDQNGVAVTGATTYDDATRTVTFTPAAALNGNVSYTVKIRAEDTGGSGVSSGGSWSFTTAETPSQPGVCPCSLFDDSTVPAILDLNDGLPVSLGTTFTSTQDGTITGVRFYKAAANTGSHTGSLWRADGTLLATGTFTGETASGWQTLTFSTPVPISKGVAYVASYYSPSGDYSVTPNAFAAGDLSRGPIHVAADAGMYQYANGFPANHAPHSYLVDVVFEKAAPAIAVSSESPADGAVGVSRHVPISITLSAPVAPGYALGVTQQPSGTPVSGTVTSAATADGTGTVITFTPDAALPYDTTFQVTAGQVVSTDGAALPTQTWSFQTRTAAPTGAETLFSGQTPDVPSTDDGSAVELGTQFVPTVDGTVSAIRFYKGTGNDGTHTGHLWSADGTSLASVTFQGESDSGWQTGTLSTPVHLNGGTTYVVSYLAPHGHYAATSGFFDQAFSSGDLTVPTGSSGVFLYAAAGGFPAYSYQASNYWVDVVFTPDPPAIAVTSRTPDDGATGVSRSVAPSVTFSASLDSGYTMTLKQGGTSIPGTVALSSNGRTLTYTPTGALPANAAITVSVDGIASAQDASLPAQTWTFHTGALTDPATLFGSQAPATADAGDSAAVELGTAFTPSVNGTITKIRFYKSAGNTGTHTGSIWSSSGQRLATVTFSGESASGWQEMALASPLAVTAGQTYVVSYYAPNGHYAASAGFFNTAVTAGPLTAPSGTNGVFAYGGGFPAGSYKSTNYWVDVVFQQS